MGESRMPKLPKKILVYQCDEAEGVPIYAVAHEAADIPEEYEGAKVGTYTLTVENTFRLHRELK